MVIIPSALAIGGSSASYYVPTYEFSLRTDNGSNVTYNVWVAHGVVGNETIADSVTYTGYVGPYGAAVLAGGAGVTFLFNFTSPKDNVTLPYTAGIRLRISDDLSTWTDCNYTLLWGGDNSTHGDWAYPIYEYDTAVVTCMSSPEYNFDTDFDGEYTLEFCGTNSTGIENCGNTTFYIDRSEMDGSGPFASTLLILGVLSLSGFLHGMSKRLNNKHNGMKIYFYILQLFIAVLAVVGFMFIQREFVKSAALVTPFNVLLYVVLIGVVTVIVIYFVLHIFKLLAEKMHFKKTGRYRGEY